MAATREGVGPSEAWEEEVCRICRGPREEDQPLYHPCACSGSIQYVHQSCLVKWLEHSKKNKCEVCKHTFRFTPIYREDAPAVVPAKVMLLGILAKVVRGTKVCSRIALGAIMWMLAVPLGTCWMGRMAFVGNLGDARKMMEGRASLNLAIADTVHGILMCTAIVITFLSITTLREYVAQVLAEERPRRHNARHGRRRPRRGQRDLQAVRLAVGREQVQDGREGTSGWIDELPIERIEHSHSPDYEELVLHENTDIVRLITSVMGFEGANGVELRVRRSVSNPEDCVFIGGDGELANSMPGARVRELLVDHFAEENSEEDHEDVRAQHGNHVHFGDMADNIDEVPLQELVGLQGPIQRLFENAFAVLVSNLVFLFITISVPYNVGRFTLGLSEVITRVGLPLGTLLRGDAGSKGASEPPAEGSAATGPMHSRLLVLGLGYATLVGSMVAWKHILSLMVYISRKQQVHSQRDGHGGQQHLSIARGISIILQGMGDLLAFLLAMTKVTGLLLIELGILPVACGWWLAVCCRPALGNFATSIVDGTVLQTSPLVASSLLWLTGLVFMLHIGTFTTALREVLRPHILPWLRDPAADPEFHPLRELVREPLRRHLRRLGLATLLYGNFAVLGLYIPTQVLSRLPFEIFPLHLKFVDPLTEIPVNIMLIHLCLPLLSVGRIHPRRFAVQVLRGWLGTASSWLNLRSYLLLPNDEERQETAQADDARQDWFSGVPGSSSEEDVQEGTVIPPEEVEAPLPYLKLRVAMLLLLSWLACFASSILLIVLPTVCGRGLLEMLNLAIQNDLNAFCVGCYAVWGSIVTVRAAARFLWTHAPQEALKIVCCKTKAFFVLITLAWMWMAGIPYLLGLLLHKAVLVPLEMTSQERPFGTHSPQTWAAGMVLLRVWHHLLMLMPEEWSFVLGMDEEQLVGWRARFQRVALQGALQLDFPQVAGEIILPIVSLILPGLLIPQFAVSLVLPKLLQLFDSEDYRETSIRWADKWAWFVLLGVVTVFHLAKLVLSWIVCLHNSIREERYIVGQQLNNFHQPRVVAEEATEQGLQFEPRDTPPSEAEGRTHSRYNLRRRPVRSPYR